MGTAGPGAAPVRTDLLSVTVMAARAASAGVLATAFLMAGAEAAACEADALGVPCLLVSGEGVTRAGGAP